MPDPMDFRRPIDRLPAHQRIHAHRALQLEAMALVCQVQRAAILGQEALLSALEARPTDDTADALDRLIAALEPLQAQAKAVRNLFEDRRTPRERAQARWTSRDLTPIEIEDPRPRLARKAARAARG